jgi:hypothetical protein
MYNPLQMGSGLVGKIKKFQICSKPKLKFVCIFFSIRVAN